MGSGTSKGFLTSILRQRTRDESGGWEERHKTPSTKLRCFDFDSFSSPLRGGRGEGGSHKSEKAKLRMDIRAVLEKKTGIECPLPAPAVLGKRSPLGKGLSLRVFLWHPNHGPSRSGSSTWQTRKGNATP